MKLCSTGHGNPDEAQFCQVCGLALASTPPVLPQPPAPSPTAAPPLTGHPPASMTSSSPQSSGNKVLLGAGIGVGAVLLLAVLVVIFVQLSKPAPEDVTVNLTLYNGADSCSVGLGYIDIPGATIIVETDDGVLHRGNLSSRGRDQGLSCLFTGTVFEVPANSSRYRISLGSDQRGDFNYTKSEMDSRNWTIDLTLGL
jgi:hypothetical protein